MKKAQLLIALFLLAMSFLTAQQRYNADIGYYDETLTLYYTQVPRTITAGTYTVVGTLFVPLYPVTLLQGIDVAISSQSAGAPNSVKVEIYAVDPLTHLPVGFPLASVTRTYAELTLSNWNFFDFSSFNLSFDAGEEFFAAQSCTNGVAGTTWYGPYLNLATVPTHSYRYFSTGTTTGWVNYGAEWYMSANVEYDAPFHDISAKSLWFTGDLMLEQGATIAYEADVENTGDQDETNVPVTIEISDITYPNRTVVYSNTQYVASLPVGTEDHISTFPAYTFNTPGEYVVKLIAQLPTDMLPSNDVVYLEQQVVVLPATLTYDDGSADGAWAPNVSGNYFANEFECPVGPVLVTQLHYYIWPDTWPVPGSTSMGIAVFDDDGFDADDNPGAPGTQLFYEEVTCVRGAWNSYDISDALVVVPSGKFFVAWRSLADYPNCPGMAVDNTAPWSAWKVSWETGGGEWYNEYPEFEMDWMMRATVNSIDFWPPEEVTITKSGPDILLDWADVPEVTSYNVYGGSEPAAVNNLIGTDIPESNYIHVGGSTDPMGFYKVTSKIEVVRSADGREKTPSSRLTRNKAAAQSALLLAE